ncbi:hypothetical protein [Thermaerobacillus caldiproteolyticus]|uniref:Uncharacterized protein n=1 Tax=Thermaerobacillus caldiproteolyticus TaxID=247480 RepID=A0A7W0C0Y9_9BACL|nr:hypothetical protein [Anoxybacillus caldiproteolyticus]MBA2876551.1 hypothetical protein [Anoxybacillus caldiproteolyticus]
MTGLSPKRRKGMVTGARQSRKTAAPRLAFKANPHLKRYGHIKGVSLAESEALKLNNPKEKILGELEMFLRRVATPN